MDAGFRDERIERDRHGHLRIAVQEERGGEQLVPIIHEGEAEDRGKAWQEQRDGDAEENADARASVDEPRFFHTDGNPIEIPFRHDGAEGGSQPDIDDNDPEKVVREFEAGEHLELRDHEQISRNHLGKK